MSKHWPCYPFRFDLRPADRGLYTPRTAEAMLFRRLSPIPDDGLGFHAWEWQWPYVMLLERGWTKGELADMQASEIMALLDRQRGEAQPEAPRPTAPPPASIDASGGRNQSKEQEALALLAKHPDWTNKQITDAIGVNPKSAYRWEVFKQARAAQQGGKAERPVSRRDARTGATEPVQTADCRHCEDTISPWKCNSCDELVTNQCRDCHAEQAHDG